MTNARASKLKRSCRIVENTEIYGLRIDRGGGKRNERAIILFVLSISNIIARFFEEQAVRGELRNLWNLENLYRSVSQD